MGSLLRRTLGAVIASLFVAAAALPVGAQDSLTVAAVAANPGGSAIVPIHIRDVAGTPLGMDQPAGYKIQGMTLKITYSPPEAVTSVSIARAGILAPLEPQFESKPQDGNTISYIGLFDEQEMPIPFNLDAAAPGDLVLNLTVGIAPAAAMGTVVTLVLDTDTSALSNVGGTVGELASEGNLTLVNGSVTVSALSATALQALPQSASGINLMWVSPGGAVTGFRIERTTDGSSWPAIATVGAGVTSYPDSGLTANTWYGYRVIATYAGAEATPSKVAAASTLPSVAAKVCVTQVSPYHSSVGGVSTASDGSGWAVAWTDRRDGNLEEIYFQRLNASDGSPAAPPVRVTQTDGSSSLPVLRWNGTHFGLLWWERAVGAPGNAGGNVKFALLAADGTKLKGDVRVIGGGPDVWVFTTPSTEDSFTWDGSGWGVFGSYLVNGTSSDLYYMRLDENGRVLVAPVRLTNNGDYDMNAVAAWNGSEYGVAWWWQRDDKSAIYFQRMTPAGVLLGSPLKIVANDSFWMGNPSVTWNGSSWAVAWMDQGAMAAEEAVFLRPIDASGNPLGAATRLSTELDPESTPGNEMAVWDEQPLIVVKPGGGYIVYCSSFLESTAFYEVTRLEADASGNRVGTRTVLSDKDTANSMNQHVATLGNNFLLAYNDRRQGTPELAEALVDSSGTLLAARRNLTTGHSVGLAGNPSVVSTGAGFAALWREPSAQIHAKLFDGSGALVGTRFPLSTRTIRGVPTAAAFVNGFAVAWKDNSNAVLFARYDTTGLVALPEVTVATGAAGRPTVGLSSFNGEEFGIAWVEGGNSRIAFQRVDPGGALVGGKSTFSTQVGSNWVDLQWVGNGWAIVWVSGANALSYARLDLNGSLAAGPITLTSNPSPQGGFQGQASMAWSGTALGLAWSEYRGSDPPGSQIYFASLNPDGTFAVTERVVAQSLGDQRPVIQWDRDRFRIVYADYLRGTYETEVMPNGTVNPPGRSLSNRNEGGPTAVWNGVTWGLEFAQLGEMYFETSECLVDVTPPPCPTVSASFGGNAVHLTWTPATDPESSLWRQILYRDGLMLAELFPGTTSYDDGGWVDGATNTYVLKGLNGAWVESVGCPGEELSRVHGDANGDGTVNVLDIFYLINNLFAGGPPPVGPADCNGDGSLTVADVFYLINWLFAGGPAPV